jgi:NAD(P)-dependent dehydrogenase (short-subunit alcohol dehydrogenase family)
MDLGLKNKRALVTGASSGIGRSCAIELAAEGARVCCTGRDQQRLSNVVQYIKEGGGDAFWVPADLSTMEGCQAVMDACISEYGGIDILVNNAGAAQNVDLLTELTTDFLDDALGLKTYSFLRLSKLAFPHMQAQKWGRIVNIAGAAGTSPTTGNLAASFANVTILNLTRAFQDAGAADGILVNTICPGATNTPRTRHHRVAAAERAGRMAPTEADIDEMIAKQGAALPVGRMCEPEEVARVAAFLSSEACSYVQASAIYMDGGSRRSTP